MRSGRGEEERMRKEGKINERVPNRSQDSPKSSTLPCFLFLFVFFCLAAANGPMHDAVSSLSPVRFHTGTNWIIYVSRAGSAVAPLQLQSAGDKNGKLVHRREVEKKSGRDCRQGRGERGETRAAGTERRE